MRVRKQTPTGHGEVLADPPYDSWPGLAGENARLARGWNVLIAGIPLAQVRREARREATAAAAAFSRVLDVPVDEPPVEPELLVMTGHQPELYHPGIWVKDFLLQRLAEETGATAIDVVVDSDAFDRIELRVPCMRPDAMRCTSVLSVAGPDSCFATTPAPTPKEVAAFRDAGLDALSTLPAPALLRHFGSFAEALATASEDSGNLAEAITIARRRYEAPAGTTYLELPLTHQAAMGAFLRFLTHLVLSADAFAEAYNAELDAFRARTSTRSAAQPFPDLRQQDDLVELPFWWLEDGRRHPVWARLGRPALIVDGAVVVDLDADAGRAFALMLAAGPSIAPKALALTMFERVLVADLFIHGVGGGRYDEVTDGVIRRFLGIEPPRYVVASMTLHLPLGGHEVTEEEIAAAEQRLNRLQQNPDQLLGEIEFDTADERERATSLSEEKCALVVAIGRSDADKKAIGARIREVNADLARLMVPLVAGTAEELERLQAQRDAGEVLTDRTYAFCLWDPREVADKVR